jgi:hypothetical protein
VNAATGTEMSTDRRIGRGWVAFTTVAMWAIFLQSVTAGRILSGDDWAWTTHDAGPHPSRGFPSPRPAAVRGRVVMTRPVPPTKEHQP